MNIAVIGSRQFPHRHLVTAYIDTLPGGTLIVSGGAIGVDTWAEEAAIARGLPTLIHRVDWRLGRGAAHYRNAQIVKHSHLMAAFWDGRSRGTYWTFRQMVRANKLVEVILPSGRHLTDKEIERVTSNASRA